MKLIVCKTCSGEGWVCERHEDKAWEIECGCSPGIPCPTCNEDGKDLPPGFTVVASTQDPSNG